MYDFEFRGDEQTYEDLVRHFFSFHDLTTSNRQGNDVGSQYASTIFYYDHNQKRIALKVLEELQDMIRDGSVCYESDVITTDITPATVFYAAHVRDG